MANDERTAPTSGGRPSKVARLIEEYNLNGLGDELVAHWTGAKAQRKSLRELADFFNKRLIEHQLREAGETPIAGEPANYYRLLTDDDVSSGTRVQATQQLSATGIDIEALQNAFVSRQAIHTYLTSERDIEYQRTESTMTDRIRTINRLKGRLTSVTQDALDTTADEPDPQVTVLVQVECPNCGRQLAAAEYLADGCRCTR